MPKPYIELEAKEKKANEKFMDAVTWALNGVVTSHGDLFSDSRIAQLLALVLWKYADGVCQEFVVTMAKEWLQKMCLPHGQYYERWIWLEEPCHMRALKCCEGWKQREESMIVGLSFHL